MVIHPCPAFLFSFAFIFYRLNYFREVLSLQQNWEKNVDISHISSGLHLQVFPIINITDQSGTFVTYMNLHWHIITQTPYYTLGFIFVIHSISYINVTMICIHYYDNIQSAFTLLKILCDPLISLFSPTNPWQLLIFLMFLQFYLF